jgi:hypothetical protein
MYHLLIDMRLNHNFQKKLYHQVNNTVKEKALVFHLNVMKKFILKILKVKNKDTLNINLYTIYNKSKIKFAEIIGISILDNSILINCILIYN